MKITVPPFSVCEEILDYLKKYCQSHGIEQSKLVQAIGKTDGYTSKAISFLSNFEIIKLSYLNVNLGNTSSPFVELNTTKLVDLNAFFSSREFLQHQILTWQVFKDLTELLSEGKNEAQALKYIIANHHLKIDHTILSETLKKYINYTQKKTNHDKLLAWDAGYLIVNKKGKIQAEKARS